MFYHVLLFLECVKQKENIIMYEYNFFIGQKLDTKGGYNLFNIFLENYIGIIIKNLYLEKRD